METGTQSEGKELFDIKRRQRERQMLTEVKGKESCKLLTLSADEK